MDNYKVSGADLTSVANAIRTKGSTSAELAFPDGFVSAIQNIPTGGGSTLITKSITANGTYNASSDNADGYSSVTVAVPSKLVTGTFEGKSTDKGSAISVSIPYTGSGYPIACVIYPTNGSNKSGDAFAILAQKFIAITYSIVKNDMSSAPTYNVNSAENNSTFAMVWKYSDSDPTSITCSQGLAQRQYYDSDASNSTGAIVRFKDNTTLSVYIASTSYGFKDGIEYTYQIVYSA